MTPEDFDLLFQRYLSGSLSADENAALLSALKEPLWQKRWRELSDMEGMLAGELSIEAAPTLPNTTQPALEKPRRAKPAARHRGKPATPWFWLYASAAAIVLAIVGLNVFKANEPTPVAELQNVKGDFSLLRKTKKIAAQNKQPIFAGDQFLASSGAQATLQYADGTTLTLTGDTQLSAAIELPSPKAENYKQLSLFTGSLEASVAPQGANTPLRISTPTAQVEVIGTKFTLHATLQSARLEVRSGHVRMQKTATNEIVDVKGGFFAVAAPDQTLAVKPVAQNTPRALFDAQLSTWNITHGKWTFTNGIVTGTGQPGKFGRIESTTTYLNGELVCKLRVTGVPFAEVQFGGYRELFPLHWTTPGDWKELRIRSREKSITGTLDGKVLQMSPAGGDERPWGVISFYITTGATLEIQDARWLPDTP